MFRLVAATTALVTLTVACSTPTQNFQTQTEEFLNDDPSVAAQFGGVDVTGAACERPADTAIGTTYRCTADVPGEGTVTFRAQITGEQSFAIVGIE